MHTTRNIAELAVERMSYGPDAIAHADDGRVVFISGAAPGDIVCAHLVEEQDCFIRAEIDKILLASPQRTESPCPYAAVCGGCPWAHLSRDAQLEAKRTSVVDSLVRIGHFDTSRAEELVAVCAAPSEPWTYRNKIELAASTTKNHIVFGFHSHASTDVVKIGNCPLFDAPRKDSIHSVSGALSFLAQRNHLQIERVGIRSSKRTGEFEIALWTSPSSFPRAQVAKVLKDACHPSSIVRVLQKGSSKARRIAGVERLSGKGSWAEQLSGSVMRVSAPSFFQVNTPGAEYLIELVLEALQPHEGDIAWDLYSGAGTFTLPLAQHCSFVAAIESSGSAVRDLRRNLDEANIDNVEAIGGDAAIEDPDIEPDIVVVDPPRAGLDRRVVEALSSYGARRIAYVSCDPATLARDLARFEEQNSYRVERIQPVDLFPQSYHIESVCTLVRKRLN